MKIDGKQYRSVWLSDDKKSIHIFNQERLPYSLEILTLSTMAEAADAIVTMKTRGAPLIGVVGAYGLAFAISEDTSDRHIEDSYKVLVETRPTAINLKWALQRLKQAVLNVPEISRKELAFKVCADIADEDVELCKNIGIHGLELIKQIAAAKPEGETVNIMTHCNAGWLATVDWGTALAPIYMAYNEGIDVHVWVDETRPRNQGTLTAFELGKHGVKHTLIADNAGGHLMQHGEVDMVIVGTDRVTANGDVCNKIGTYLKALAAKENRVPFYVALPSPTIDPEVADGVKEIPIEQRAGQEQSHVQGITELGKRGIVNTAPEGTRCANYAFDVTPAELVTGLITERGFCDANRQSIKKMFPELLSSSK
ncbi:methylthioribose-1-phosphate isomerase [Endozoicomonas montiporae]|uniref:Methylthioribose-1-phosphate isomerase n=2 Tax=Endozoicomonas montiporae TaxID=1027273 RepID=A0A081N5Z1_9GAMM|nr:S-methyl-5-thioribose-1-phosphate isomerase [Endozoicomonas montiporae]AMO57222.1 methylthioribose-1-phosphate isomerase [Endozoicomonas montiporae CL-33]KEQ13864.1 methylthioribose-1-phosphate isomerase [Endozoicomonas montiporae]